MVSAVGALYKCIIHSFIHQSKIFLLIKGRTPFVSLAYQLPGTKTHCEYTMYPYRDEMSKDDFIGKLDLDLRDVVPKVSFTVYDVTISIPAYLAG